MAELILIRHCESEGQQPEAELTARGRRSAVELATRLAEWEPDVLVASPYRRAVATLEPYAARANLPIRQDARLRERELNAGEDWLEHLRRSFDDHAYRLPGGESLREARERGVAALEEIADARLAVVVSHGALISSLLGFGFAAWRALPNPALYRVTWASGFPRDVRLL